MAVQAGFVRIEGTTLSARGRRHPLIVAAPPAVVLVHVEIGHRVALSWTPGLRRRVAAAVLGYARRVPAPMVQIDFEVRRSERHVLIDVLRDVRRGLAQGTRLSMTALASWCDRERWLDQAPVDEVVPMLFRMQRGEAPILARLARGEDFRHPACRAALGVATDTPIRRAPAGRRVYLFDRRSWVASDFVAMRREVEGWR